MKKTTDKPPYAKGYGRQAQMDTERKKQKNGGKENEENNNGGYDSGSRFNDGERGICQKRQISD